MQKVIITNLLNNIIGNKINSFDGFKNSLKIASQIEDLLKDDNYIYLLVELSKDNGALLFYENIVKNLNKIVNDKKLRIIFVGDVEENDILFNILNTFNEGYISDYYDMFDNRITFIYDKKDIYKVLKRDNLLDKEIHTLINNKSDIEMLNKANKYKANSSIIGKSNLQEDELIRKYIEYKAQLEKYRDLKLLIEQGKIKDFDDEINFNFGAMNYINKEEKRVKRQLNNNTITLDYIKDYLIKYKLMFEYIDDIYLQTGMLNDNNKSKIGNVIIPRKVLNLDVYESFNDYKRTLKR